MNASAIPVMAVNAYKRRFDISFLRKHFIILRASIRHIIRKINYKRMYYSRVPGLKQNKRPGIAVNAYPLNPAPVTYVDIFIPVYGIYRYIYIPVTGIY